MSGTKKTASLAIVAALCLILGNAPVAEGQAPAAGQDAGKQPYTIAEYNAYQACAAEKVPATQVKCLDDFVSKYQNSALLVYIYPLYFQAYYQLKNYAKSIEYVDKLLALGDKVDAGARYQALSMRAYAFAALTADPAQAKWVQEHAKGAQDAAVAGLKALDEVKKPEALTEDQFAAEKKKIQKFFNGTGAQAAVSQKDYAGAIPFYKAALLLDPDDGVTSYQMGRAYLAMTPPDQMNGLWAVARGATAKSATEKQSKDLKAYLRKLVVNYQQASCDSLTDAELSELLQLAGSSVERPASYKLASNADLDAARKDMTIASVVADLKAGGDKGKVTWLAACGLEFPDVPGKLLEVVPGGDPVVLKMAFVTNEAEFEAANTPNMEVRVVGQPAVEKLEKDSAPRFTATLASYDPDPAFMLHWDKAKVNEEDLPKEKGPAKKPARRPAAKKPG